MTFEELHFYQVGVVDGVCMVFIVSKRLTPPFILEALGLRIASMSGAFMASILFANYREGII